MAAAAAILSVVSGVTSAIGSIQAGNAAAARGEYNARVQERNMVIEDQDRKTRLQQAAIAADDKRRETRRLLSSIRASYGASGFELAGSPLDVLEDTAIESELDASRVEFQAHAENRSSAIKFLQLGENATLSRMEGDEQKRASRLGAFGHVVGGVGSGLKRLG